MPGFNRRGPEGDGPMTGRGLGSCAPKGRRNVSDSFDNTSDTPFLGRGFGRQALGGMGYGLGRGMGRLMRNRRSPALDDTTLDQTPTTKSLISSLFRKVEELEKRLSGSKKDA